MGSEPSMRRIRFDTVDSTNTQARLLASGHPGEPLLVTADVQTAGRGRHGRSWQSPRGGAWMSVVWPLATRPAESAAASLVAAVAVRRALGEVASEVADRLLVKWPNDVLLADRKVAGILCEQFLGGDASPSGVLIIGVGVNVDFDLSELGDGLRHPPTTLRAELGRAVAVDAVIDAVADRLAAALVQFDATGLDESLLGELRRHLAYVGTIRTWDSPTGRVSGRVLGIDDAGRLLLSGPAGKVACAAGELLSTGDASSAD
jgi:BirA family biotin operon repressor/biotin-[acetyl-CoA-carboxylase] ligase